MAFISGDPLPKDEEYCKIDLAKLHFRTRGSHSANAAFEDLLEHCITKLDPEDVREELLEYLHNRLAKTTPTDLPTASAASSLEDIVDVLHVLNGVNEDVTIRCAYAQILLFYSVQQRVSNNREIPRGNHRAAYLNVLKDVAARKAGGVSERESDRIYKSYQRDYHAGKNWVDVIDMFGGDAIVILFVLAGKVPRDYCQSPIIRSSQKALTMLVLTISFANAGVGSWYVTHHFTEYQRACLIHISSHLYSIKILVNSIGPKALERYCRRGCLDESVVETVESVDL